MRPAHPRLAHWVLVVLPARLVRPAPWVLVVLPAWLVRLALALRPVPAAPRMAWPPGGRRQKTGPKQNATWEHPRD
jgi:hypothetical protein